jgi:hypothetical protein
MVLGCPWFINPAPGSTQIVFNQMMSSSRIAVEWGYSMITQLFEFLDFKREKPRSSSPQYQSLVAQFFTNGAQATNYFNADLLSLDEYLGLIDSEDQCI